MSNIVFRCSLRLGPKRVAGLCTPLCSAFVQTAEITSAGGKPRQRERKPFDYRRSKFTMLHQPFDRTLARMDENSKVIVIDGPIASGKTKFAKQLANELDFKFVPQPNLKSLYLCGDDGLTFQDLDELLPSELRVYDHEAFHKDETPAIADGRGRAGELQLDYFAARTYTYNDALLHLLSTGQGVVCVRSPWSDRVFARALYDNGYLSAAGLRYYDEEMVQQHTIDFPRPHLIIYLDADVEETKDNIKRKNNDLEMNSKILTEGFLASIENEYKDVVLPSFESHSELLVYPSIPDITEHEVALMVEDIEALGPIAHSGVADDQFLGDWKYLRDEELAQKRRFYQDQHLSGHVEQRSRPWHVPEMLRDNEFSLERARLYNNQPGWKHHSGYDPDLHPWWKIAMGIPMHKPMTERRHFWIPA